MALQEFEIFLRDEETETPTAIAIDPDHFKTEAMREIVRGQIFAAQPKTIFCNIGGVYDVIEPGEFEDMKITNGRRRHRFIEQVVSTLKGPYTTDIIIAEKTR